MTSTTERRWLILTTLVARRRETMSNLAAEFHVSVSTIKNDVLALSCFAPILTVRGHGGGVCVDEHFYIGRIYLQKEQEALLRALLPRLEPKEQIIMQSILEVFAFPKVS